MGCWCCCWCGCFGCWNGVRRMVCVCIEWCFVFVVLGTYVICGTLLSNLLFHAIELVFVRKWDFVHCCSDCWLFWETLHWVCKVSTKCKQNYPFFFCWNVYKQGHESLFSARRCFGKRYILLGYSARSEVFCISFPLSSVSPGSEKLMTVKQNIQKKRKNCKILYWVRLDKEL